MPRKQVAQLAQRGGDVEARIGQRLAGDDAGEGDGRVGLARHQHLAAALPHVADEAVAGAGDDGEIDAVERVCAAVEKLREMSPLYEMAQEGIDLSKVQWAAH